MRFNEAIDKLIRGRGAEISSEKCQILTVWFGKAIYHMRLYPSMAMRTTFSTLSCSPVLNYDATLHIISITEQTQVLLIVLTVAAVSNMNEHLLGLVGRGLFMIQHPLQSQLWGHSMMGTHAQGAKHVDHEQHELLHKSPPPIVQLHCQQISLIVSI